MRNPVAHFEIYGDDPEKLAGFYKKIFNWEVSPSGFEGYWLIKTVATDERGAPTEPGGINGGLFKRQNPDWRAWINYVNVDAIDETIKQASALGATVHRPKSAVPKLGWFAILTDPDQNIFGLWQDDPNAG